jgi:fructokinase
MQNHIYYCCFGEILWDVFPAHKLPGGAPMNVALGLQNGGLPAMMISRAGEDADGAAIKAFLGSKNCSTAWIQSDTEHPTGLVKVLVTEEGENGYEIVEPAAWDFIALSPEITDLVRNAYGCIYGTLSCRNAVTRNTLFSLLDFARLKIYDVNLRAPFYSKELVEALLSASDIVKMNEEELKIITDWYDIKDRSEEVGMIFIRDLFKLNMLLVTRGANGASLLHEKGFFHSAGFKVPVKDTVGCGDAFLAGFIKSMLNDCPPQEALVYAAAMGAVVAGFDGANPDIREEDILALIDQI